MTIDIDGIWYHSRDVYNDKDEIIGEELLLDDENEPIPADICICHAYEPNECICGAWDDVTNWDYD